MNTLNDYINKYKLKSKDAVWECHGRTIVLHKALETIATGEGVVFDMPQVIEAKADEKIAVVLVSGTMGDKSDWSFGEAAPYNNKMGYPYAMAEKRAKDRVILKLLGLHGEVYSESEADDFRKPTSYTKHKFATKSSSEPVDPLA